MKNFVYFCIILFVSACLAPRCPEKSCHVGMEHRHNGQAFKGRGFSGGRLHTPWWYITRNSPNKQKGEGMMRANKDKKSKKKFKKLLPWEKVN